MHRVAETQRGARNGRERARKEEKTGRRRRLEKTRKSEGKKRGYLRHFQRSFQVATSSCMRRGEGRSRKRQRSARCLYFSRTMMGLRRERERSNSLSWSRVMALFGKSVWRLAMTRGV